MKHLYNRVKGGSIRENAINSNLWGTKEISTPLKIMGERDGNSRALVIYLLFLYSPLPQMPHCLTQLLPGLLKKETKNRGDANLLEWNFSLFLKSLPQWYHLIFLGLVPPNHCMPGKYPSLSPIKVSPSMARRSGGWGSLSPFPVRIIQWLIPCF